MYFPNRAFIKNNFSKFKLARIFQTTKQYLKMALEYQFYQIFESNFKIWANQSPCFFK